MCIEEKHFIIIILGVFLITGLLLALIFSGGKNKEASENFLSTQQLKKNMTNIRKPAAAGTFYPAEPVELKQKINNFLEKAAVSQVSGFIKGLIVPHAGYDYSGQVAGYGFKALKDYFKPEQNSPITIILLGPSHNYYAQGAILDASDFWETPLGLVEINKDLANRLNKQNFLFQIGSSYHVPEHSLEAEVPFLQNVFSEINLVPILVGELNQEDTEKIAQTLAENADENTIFIASTDLSHYPSYENANYADKKTIQAVLTGQTKNLQETIAELERENIANLATCMCGEPAVEILMSIMQKLEADNIIPLKYANSGDTEIGDKLQVVGYASIIFSSKRKGMKLNQQEQERLLAIARQSVESYIKVGTCLLYTSPSPRDGLLSRMPSSA